MYSKIPEFSEGFLVGILKFNKSVDLKGSDSLCSEQHFCSCPPFLKSSRQDDDHLHFTKHNYDDQYAILGKSKVPWRDIFRI